MNKLIKIKEKIHLIQVIKVNKMKGKIKILVSIYQLRRRSPENKINNKKEDHPQRNPKDLKIQNQEVEVLKARIQRKGIQIFLLIRKILKKMMRRKKNKRKIQKARKFQVN